MYINTFKYTPKDVSCQLCTEYVKKLGCTSSSQSPLVSVSADGENCARSLAPPLPTKSATLRGPQTCPWLAERIEAGVVGYREAVLETFPHERRLFQRLNLLIKHYPGSLWSNEQHERRMQYQRAVQGYRRRRDTNAYYAAMYLLTSNDDIYRRTANCFCKHGIEFGYIRLKADMSVTSKELYAIYEIWCDENGLTPIRQRSFSDFLMRNLKTYNLEHTNTVTNATGRRVWGYLGIEPLINPRISENWGKALCTYVPER